LQNKKTKNPKKQKKLMNNNLLKETIIKAIEKAFDGMRSRNEKTAYVKLFIDVRELTLPDYYRTIHPSKFLECDFVHIVLKREGPFKRINLYYHDKKFVRIPFMIRSDREAFFECLHTNKIIPTEKEFLDTKSLDNSILANFIGYDAVENMLHCSS